VRHPNTTEIYATMVDQETIITLDSVTSADGTEIGYRRMGDGPGLILLHGGLQSSLNLMRLGLALSKNFTVYIPDRRGRGLSGSHAEIYSVEKACEDMRSLQEKTGATNVFGLSVGALISLWTALKLQAVRKVALYEPPLLVDPSYSLAWVDRYNREMAQGRWASALVTILKGVETSPIISRAPRFILEPIFRLALKKESEGKGGGPTVKTLIPTMHFDLQIVRESAEQLDEFKGVNAEVLLLGGSKSPAYLRIALDRLNRVIDRSKRVTFPGLDHLGPDDSGEPEVIAQELKWFFNTTIDGKT
jgi:pimeloyl-ACP methyl ester carboxylesterase